MTGKNDAFGNAGLPDPSGDPPPGRGPDTGPEGAGAEGAEGTEDTEAAGDDRATIYDVAELAGVAPSTVSRTSSRPAASVPGPPRRSWPPPASWAAGRPPKSAPTGPSATRAATCWAWWSRASSTRSSRSSCSARLQLTTDDGVVGRDAREIEDTWQFLYRSAYWRRGAVTMAAIAAVDMALWDIKGKMAGRRSTTCWAVRRAPAPALTATPQARAWSRCSTPSATRWSSATP